MSIATISCGVLVGTNCPEFIGEKYKSAISDVINRFMRMMPQNNWTNQDKSNTKNVAYVLQRAMQYGGEVEFYRHNKGFEGAVIFEDIRDSLKFQNAASSEITGYVLKASMNLPNCKVGSYRTVEEAMDRLESLASITNSQELKIEMKRAACMFRCAKENKAKLEKMVQSEHGQLNVIFSFNNLGDKEKFENTIEECLEVA